MRAEDEARIEEPWWEPVSIAEAGETLPSARQRPSPIAIFGIVLDNLTLAETLARIDLMVESRRPHYIATANVDFLVQARGDAELRQALLDAHLVLCDGTPLVWASRLLGNPLPERVAGSDLVPQLLSLSAKNGYRLFFLGADPESNAQAVLNVQRRFPGIKIVGQYSPPFKPLSELDHTGIGQRILRATPDILLVAFGCPKAEKWMAMHCDQLEVPVMIGVGATIDFLADRMRRAPPWMRRTGLEWAFRTWQEPRRLCKRYAVDAFHFGWTLAEQWWRLRFVPAWRARPMQDGLETGTNPLCGPVYDAERVGLDLSDVESIDSTGAALLLRLGREARLAGRKLTLSKPSRSVEAALRFLRARDYFEVVD